MTSAAAAARRPLPTDVLRRRRRGRIALVALVVFVAFLLLLAQLGFFAYVATVVGVTLVASWVFAEVGVLGVQVERDVGPTEVEIGESSRVRLVLDNGKGLGAPWLFWEDRVSGGGVVEGAACGLASFEARERRDLSYSVHFGRRGLHSLGPTLVEASDPFGLVRRYRLFGRADFVHVLPRVVPLKAAFGGRRPAHEIPRRRSFLDDPTRFLGIRDFRHGDSLRRVHWKATARTGRLQTRVFEPVVLDGVLLAVDQHERSFRGLSRPPGPGEEARKPEADPEVELAITTAASLAAHVLGGGQAAGLLSNGADAAESFPDDWTGATFRRAEAALAEAGRRRRITRRRPFEASAAKGTWHGSLVRTALARLVPSRGLKLAELIISELPRLPRSLVLTVVTPAVTEELAAAMAAAQRSGIDTALVQVDLHGCRGTPRVTLPRSAPWLRVTREEDLMLLGGASL